MDEFKDYVKFRLSCSDEFISFNDDNYYCYFISEGKEILESISCLLDELSALVLLPINSDDIIVFLTIHKEYDFSDSYLSSRYMLARSGLCARCDDRTKKISRLALTKFLYSFPYWEGRIFGDFKFPTYDFVVK